LEKAAAGVAGEELLLNPSAAFSHQVQQVTLEQGVQEESIHSALSPLSRPVTQGCPERQVLTESMPSVALEMVEEEVREPSSTMV
jgi:hypothetical protein